MCHFSLELWRRNVARFDNGLTAIWWIGCNSIVRYWLVWLCNMFQDSDYITNDSDTKVFQIFLRSGKDDSVRQLLTNADA